MMRCRSRLVSVVIAMAVLVMSISLRALENAPVVYACTDCQSVTNTPTVVVTLNGTDQTVSYPLDFSLNNTGIAGWHVSISSTQFVTGSTPVHILPTSVSTVTGVTWVCQISQSCTADPKNAITYPVGVPIAPSANSFYDAQANSGIGTFDITAAISIVVPENTYIGSYTSTITVDLSDGP